MITFKYFVDSLKYFPLPELIHLKMGMGLYYEVLCRTNDRDISEVQAICQALNKEVSDRISKLQYMPERIVEEDE